MGVAITMMDWKNSFDHKTRVGNLLPWHLGVVWGGQALFIYFGLRMKQEDVCVWVSNLFEHSC